MDKNSKIALVTGAGSGIGKAVAIALCQDGWQVVLAGRREKPLLDTAAACRKESVLVVPTDVTKPQSVKNLFAQTIETYGRLDLLFNNAGVSGPSKPFEELTLDDWQRVVDTNLSGAFLCAREAFGIMKRQEPIGGRIINNGSISAHVPRPQSAPYTASKHAITGLTKAIALDGRDFNIACGQIDIGNASSAMTQKMEAGIRQADGSLKIEPTMRVEDVGRTVVYMAGLPLNTNVPFLTIMANLMPYMGRG
ncbi:MAG: SDR family oxidoreductase [Flavobacteriaceae bacterium]